MENDSNWKSFAKRKEWIKDLFNQNNLKPDSYYRRLFHQATRDIRRIKSTMESDEYDYDDLLEVPLGDDETLTCIAGNDQNIFIGTSHGNIKILKFSFFYYRKGPMQWNDDLNGGTGRITFLKERFL